MRRPCVLLAIGVLSVGLTAGEARADSATFENTGSLTFSNTFVPDNPSVIDVCGLAGKITKVTATLKNIQGNAGTRGLYPLQAVLVAPDGKNVTLLDGTGYDYTNPQNAGFSSLTITLDDSASANVANWTFPSSGTYKPTLGVFGTSNLPQAGAPGPPFGDQMSDLNGGDPNGAWKLYVDDNDVYTPHSASISGGYGINITTDGTASPARASCQPPQEYDWIVKFKIKQKGLQRDYPPEGLMKTTTKGSGQARFDEEPKAGGAVTAGVVENLFVKQTDYYYLEAEDKVVKETRLFFSSPLSFPTTVSIQRWTNANLLMSGVNVAMPEDSPCPNSSGSFNVFQDYGEVDQPLMDLQHFDDPVGCEVNRFFTDEGDDELVISVGLPKKVKEKD